MNSSSCRVLIANLKGLLSLLASIGLQAPRHRPSPTALFAPGGGRIDLKSFLCFLQWPVTFLPLLSYSQVGL